MLLAVNSECILKTGKNFLEKNKSLKLTDPKAEIHNIDAIEFDEKYW